MISYYYLVSFFFVRLPDISYIYEGYLTTVKLSIYHMSYNAYFGIWSWKQVISLIIIYLPTANGMRLELAGLEG
ncbi:hypothetical protein BDV19DRAFT_5843 [Aspergillus venezuelensis]